MKKITKNTQSNLKSFKLENHIIENIYRMETKKIIWTVGKYLFFIILFSTVSMFLAVTLIAVLSQQQTLDLLELFKEDWEIIKTFLPDVLNTFYIEMPKDLTLLFLLAIILFLVTLIMVIKNIKKIKNKVNSILKYRKLNKIINLL